VGVSIVSGIVSPEKVIARDTASYCGILFEDNRLKPICRLHFNNPNNLQIETFDVEKKGTRHKLEKTLDIHKHADSLRATVASDVKNKES